MSSEDAARWERDLEREIRFANRDLRGDSPMNVDVKWGVLLEEAKSLGIDPERAKRIAVAAEADLSWDETVTMLQIRGMSREFAEEATENIAYGILAQRRSDRSVMKRERDRTEWRWLIFGLVVVATAIGLGIFYWPSWFASTVSFVRQCFTAT